MEDTYEKAYTEVIELLKFFPRESLEKIPEEKLNLYINKMDRTYNYKIDKSKSFEQQKMLEKTKAVFAIIFRDYWATDYQRERIFAKEQYDKKKIEEAKKERFNPDDIFKSKKIEISRIETDIDNKSMLVYKESIFRKIIDKIKKIFRQ